MEKILISGGAGFIGSHLADRLLDEGNKVTAIDNLSLGKEDNLETALKNKNFKLVKGDILDAALLDNVFAEGGFDTVYHFAANSNIAKSFADPDTDFNDTFRTTYAILNAMRRHGVKKIVFASTSAIYGDAKGKPVSENFGPLMPISHYGAGKLASEAFISSFCENYGIQAWIVRFPNVIGERATHGVIYDFIKKLCKNPDELEVLGDGSQRKPYLYVKDLVDAVLFVREKTSEQVNIYNAGVEDETSVTDIANAVISKMGLDAKIKYTGGDRGWVGDVPKFSYSLDKIHALGWKASNSSDEAVAKSIVHILKFDK